MVILHIRLANVVCTKCIIKGTVDFQCTHALILGCLIGFWGVIVHKEGAQSQQVGTCLSAALSGDKSLISRYKTGVCISYMLPTIKSLGVILDQDMTFNPQTKQTSMAIFTSLTHKIRH